MVGSVFWVECCVCNDDSHLSTTMVFQLMADLGFPVKRNVVVLHLLCDISMWRLVSRVVSF